MKTQISATGKARLTLRPIEGNHNARQAGFSLVELMIVVFIIGLMSAVIVLSAPTTRSDLQKDAGQLQAFIEAAADEAIVSGRPYGVSAEGGIVRSLRWENGGWTFVSGASLGADSQILLEAVPGSNETNNPAPLVWFDPNGMGQPGEFRLVGDGEEALMRVGRDGRVSVASPEGS